MTFKPILIRHAKTWRRWRGGLLLAACLPALAAASLPEGKASAAHIHEFTLTSSESGQAYFIQVTLPSAPPPKSGYPVLYLLDGNTQLPRIEVAQESRRQRELQDRPLLVVAIGYPEEEGAGRERRSEDYTPAISSQAQTHSRSHPHGGADRFLHFIQTELKPEIDRRFTANGEEEAIMGHSYGGLFVLHTLLNQPQSFKRYIAISPSLWWYGDKPLETLNPASLAVIPHGTQLLLGVGSEEQPGSSQPLITERARRLEKRAMIDNTQAFAEWARIPPSALEVSFTLYPGENHGSVMGPAIHEALAFIGQPTF